MRYTLLLCALAFPALAADQDLSVPKSVLQAKPECSGPRLVGISLTVTAPGSFRLDLTKNPCGIPTPPDGGAVSI